MKLIIKTYFGPLYGNEFENLDYKHTFLEKYNITEITVDGGENLIKRIIIKKIDGCQRGMPTQKQTKTSY